MPKVLVRLLAFSCLLLLVLPALPAFGAETGTLRGTVRDASNQAPLEGVQITLEGPGLPGGRSRTSDARGNFWFPVLPPGNYRITFSHPGFQTRAYDAGVRLDQTTTLPPVELNLVTFTSETIEIVETSPVIDNTQSAAMENVDEDYFERLPVGRSYQSIIRTLPGVFGRINYDGGGPSNGNPSVRGEGPYGNNYLLEGFTIRDPADKMTGPDFPFDALQEITVLTDGAPAEFGNFTGMLANMVLKSGQNETEGTLSFLTSTNASFGEYKIMGEDVEKRQFISYNPTLTLGGPIVEDKIWYYGALDYYKGNYKLEGSEVTTNVPYDYMLVSKITYSPFDDSSSLLNFIFQKQGSQLDKAGANAYTAEKATVDTLYDMLSFNANLKSVLSPYVVFEAKWNRFKSKYHDEPRSGSLQDSSYIELNTGMMTNNVDYLYATERDSDGIALHLTRYVTEAMGQHVMKGGYEYSKSSNSDELTYTGGLGTEASPAYDYTWQDLNGNEVMDPGEEYSRTANYNVGPLSHTTNQSVLFLQDQWQPVPNLTLNLGLRANNESLLQNAGQEVIDQWVYAPRFGLAWDVTEDSNNLVTMNAGRYYDINGLAFVDWADTQSANYFTRCYYDNATMDYTDSCYTQDPITNPVEYSEGLTPYHMDKFTLGYTRALFPSVAVGIKGIVSTTRDLPEDTQRLPGIYLIENAEQKRRDYWAIELTAEKKFSDNWQFLAAVTYSRSRGTNPGQFESGSTENSGGNGNEVGLFMDNISDPWLRLANTYFGYDFRGLGYTSYEAFGETSMANAEGWYGYLPYHSFVNIKVNGSYHFSFGTEVGLVYEFDSGHAWQRRGMQSLFATHNTFPEGRGSRFMPPIHYLDLRLAHRLPLPHDLSLLAEVTVFNIFDFERATGYYENYNEFEDAYGYENANENFGKVLYRQSPRSLRANVTFEF